MKKIGLVGLGFIGKIHLEAYQKIEQAQVKAICTRNRAKVQEVLSLYNGSIVSVYEDLLNDPEIDIIDICLPTYLHEDYIIKAANAGKQIICEKPLTLTIESANRIVEAVQKNKVNLFVAHVLRFRPEYQTIKAYSQNDQLTGIEWVEAKRLGQIPTWSNWFQHPDKSGGALLDLHIHDVDFLYYLLGEVETVYAVGSQNPYGAWDHVMTTLILKNKCKAFAEASQRMPNGYPFTMSLRAQTKEHTLEFKVLAGENIDSLDVGERMFFYYANQKKTSVHIEQIDAFQNELSYFVNCLERDEENTVIPLKDVLYTLKLIKAIEASLETGQVIKIESV